ncbi:TetR/AcrR family transcriptional regulator [Kitasatospora sp. NPDC002040]|uniref:TetR/AcrR family transcriptional regulator n=1 Tax=Kitasatospora sp. NPDC002040 TaxID=3154661 RepID=UPI0033174BB8
MAALPETRDHRPRRTARRRTVDTTRREELLTEAEAIILAEGFTAVTMDGLARQLGCSKATLYSLAATKEQLVLAVTRSFFRKATADIEQAVADEADPRQRIRTYLAGIATAMRRHSPAFYDDMVGYEPTARVYQQNSAAAAQRVHDLIEAGMRADVFREVNGHFAAHVVTVTIDAIRSGTLLETTGLTAAEAVSELGDLLLNGLRPA